MRYICLLLAVLFAGQAAARGPFGSIVVGNWTGGAYTDDASGQFSGCNAGTTFRSGIYVNVLISPDGSWRLGFANPAWRLEPGLAVEIRVSLDGAKPIHGIANAFSANLVSFEMPKPALQKFRKAKVMNAVIFERAWPFDLSSTAPLVLALENCVSLVKKVGVAALPDLTAPSRLAVPTTDVPLEAMGIATNFILRGGFRNPRVLDQGDTPADLRGNGAAWRADDASGFVRIHQPSGSVKGIDVAAGLLASDAKDCKGKFTSARRNDLLDAEVVFQAMSTCDDSKGTRLNHYFITPRAKGGFAVFAVIQSLQRSSAEPHRTGYGEESLSAFRRAALSAAVP